MKLMNIGERIKQRRVELELSVDEVASRLGKNRATVYRYENSDIENLPTTVLEPLARILQTTPAYLMGYDAPKSKEPTLEQIITNQIKKLGTTLEEVAEEANVAYEWLKNINSVVPGYMEYMLDDPKNYPSPGRELDWNDEISCAYKSYEWISRVAEVLNLPSSMLRAALAEQEITPDDWDIPLPDDWEPITATEAFGFTNIISSTQSTDEKNSFRPTTKEQNMIKQYRTLDSRGRDIVETVLNREAERMTELETTTPSTVIDIQTRLEDNTRFIEYRRSASAGTGVFILGNEGVDQRPIPDTPENRKVDYAIKVSGNSMEPDYYDGDIVLVSQKVELNHGDVGIFIINNDAYIKEYGETELISRNPDADNIIISEYGNIVCMGKVVGKYEE